MLNRIRKADIEKMAKACGLYAANFHSNWKVCDQPEDYFGMVTNIQGSIREVYYFLVGYYKAKKSERL